MMIRSAFTRCRRPVSAALLCAAAVAPLLASSPALAWWRGGVTIGIAPPLFYPPPIYYPPPAYYPPPPPVVYAPPPPAYAPSQGYAPPPGGAIAQSCYAGPYACPMVHPTPAGATCWCPDSTGGRSYGRAS